MTTIQQILAKQAELEAMIAAPHPLPDDALTQALADRMAQEPVAFIREPDIGRTQMICISNMIYRSVQDARNRTPYVPVYCAPKPTQKAEPLREFLAVWIADGSLQTFEHREKFRAEARSLLGHNA